MPFLSCQRIALYECEVRDHKSTTIYLICAHLLPTTGASRRCLSTSSP
nr:MAG TPA: hypothetical protein [Caudoviricetes sp.]